MNPDERRQWRRRVFGCAEMTPAQRLVLVALESFSDWPEGTNARPGVAGLSVLCGLSPRAVEGALGKGRELGFIEQTARANPKRGHAACYRLISTSTDMRVEEISDRTTVRVEDGFNPHGSADGTGVLSAHFEFQPARNDVSTRTVVQPTKPITPKENTKGARAAADAKNEARELIRATTTPPLNSKILDRLLSEVEELLNEGHDHELIAEALRRLDQRADAGPGLLPYLCLEVDKARRQVDRRLAEDDRTKALRAAIDACPDCDEYGRDLYDANVDCRRHANFRERKTSA